MTTRQSRLTQAQKNMVVAIARRTTIGDTAATRRVVEQLARKGLVAFDSEEGYKLTTEGLACYGDLHQDDATMAAASPRNDAIAADFAAEHGVTLERPAAAAPEAFTMDDAAQAPVGPAATPARRRGGRRAQPQAAPEPIDAEWPEPGTPSASDARELAAPAEQEALEAAFSMDDAPEAAAAPTAERDGLSALEVDALRAKYLEVVGRPTGSTNKAYLIWKIREVQKGRIAAGPTRASRRTEEGAAPRQVKVLPVGLDADVVEALDAAWKAAGHPSRMAFFRSLLGEWARAGGEATVFANLAALLAR